MKLYPSTVNIANDPGLVGFKSLRSPSQPLQPDKSQYTLNHPDQISVSEEAKNTETAGKHSGDKNSNPHTPAEPPGLTWQDLTRLRTLKRRDLEVRSHEQAHISTAGKYAKGGVSLVYQKGPDGGSYAVGGEVSIDVSAESNPEATIAKMQTIKRAALAPLNPSPADRGIAAQAASKEALARQQLIKEQHEILATEASPANRQQFDNNFQAKKSDVFSTSRPPESFSTVNIIV